VIVDDVVQIQTSLQSSRDEEFFCLLTREYVERREGVIEREGVGFSSLSLEGRTASSSQETPQQPRIAERC